MAYDLEEGPLEGWMELGQPAKVALVTALLTERADPGAALSPSLGARWLVVIEEQVRSGEPAATGEALARLLGQGMQRAPAIAAIAEVWVAEMARALKAGESPDLARLGEALGRLEAAALIAAAMRRGLSR